MLLKKLPRRWGAAAVPLGFLLVVALPLSAASSPVDARGPAVLAASVALALLVSTVRRAVRRAGPGPRRPAMLGWVRAYFALGAGLALYHQQFRANELAGVMLLFAPLALALSMAGSPGVTRRIWRLQAALLTLLFAGLLVTTWSRGGLLSLGLAAGVVLFLLSRRRLLSIGLLSAVAALLLTSSGHGLDFLLHDGQVKGLSVDSVLTGRPEIWRRSLHVVADFPFTGIGVGTFRQVVPVLYYPPGRALEHAHNLFLQTALDLGLPGLLAFAGVLWLAFRRLVGELRRAPAGPRKVWATGLFASLAGFIFFNLFDAVPFGTAGNVAFWFLLGLVFALPAPRPGGRRRHLLLAALLALLALLILPSARRAAELNRAALAGARVMLDSGELAAARSALERVRRCRARWLLGKLGGTEQRDDAWSDLLRCSAAFVEMIEEHAPHSRILAEAAVEHQPSSAAAWFWLARIQARSGEAAASYRRGLAIEPRNGLAWQQLGRLLAATDPAAALEAHARACRHGDPGANACLAAGRLAEHFGDLEAAIGYYRRSRFSKARERADQLDARSE